MRRTLVLISIIALFASAKSQAMTVTRKGDKAILFNFVGLSAINLNAYDGGIGGKYFISNSLAIRGMLLFGLDNRTTNGSPNITDDFLSYGIGGGLEWHLPLTSNISPYLGGELSYQNEVETTNPGNNKTTSDTFQIGALGGVEYFFNQNLSLSAEYRFGFTNSSTTPALGSKSSEVQLGFQTAGLTLAVYF